MVRDALLNRAPRALLKEHSHAREAGFTLIELLAVITIMIVITGIVLANNNRFGGKVLLQNLVYDVALTVREAQVYGISVERFSGTTFASAYGVHFLQSTDPATLDEFILFADINTSGRTGVYDCPDADSPTTCELVSAYDVQKGFKISNLCVTLGNGDESCGHASLDVSFERPNPDAFIRVDGIDTLYSGARIEIISPQEDRQSIIIQENGQIAVQ